jgi:hypothetical protein
MIENEARMVESPITAEMIADIRSKFGLTLNGETTVNNEYASRLAILKFTGGIGKVNLLWNNEKYTRQGIYQRGEETMFGQATVVLPSRDNKYWPLDRLR